MGLLKNITGIVDKSVEIIDQAVLDKDKANELKTDLVKSVATLLLSGKGSSITKVTICALVSIVTLIGSYIFLFKPGDIAGYKDYALAVTPLIGILVGAYATGTTFQKINK
jgi:hypothetical protein